MATDQQAIEVGRRLARGERLRICDAGLSNAQWKTVIATLISLGFAEQAADGQIWMLSPEDQTAQRRAAQRTAGAKRRCSPPSTGQDEYSRR